MEENKLKITGINSNGFGIIAKLVMQDRNLSLGAKGVYAYFCSYAGAGNICFPSRKKMCYDLGISQNTLSKYLKELIKSSYVSCEQIKENGKFSHNVYTINTQIPLTKIPLTKFSDTQILVNENLYTNNNNYINNNYYNNNNITHRNENEKINVETSIPPMEQNFHTPLENQGVDYQGVGFLGVDNLGLENQGQLNTNKLNTNNTYRKEQKFYCQQVADAFNETCVSLPRVTKLTDKRKKAIKSILKKHSLEELKNIFKKVEYSSFLNGSSGKWSGATFDWILKESNLIKVIEGNYDDKGKYNNFHGTPSYDINSYESEISDNYENYLDSFANK